MGVPVDVITEAGTIDHILASRRGGIGGWVVTANVDILRQIVADPGGRALVAGAALIVADGMPLVWASRLQHSPLPERVAGSALITTLSAAAGDAGEAVFLLGGRPGAAERAAEQLRRVTPGLRVGWHCPPLGFEERPAQRRAIDEALEAFGPAIVYCGFGFPKQERLMAELHPRFPGWWFLASGASIDFLAGETRRAPTWAQRAGIEWVYRLAQEPQRLFRRYVIDDTPFALRLLVSAARAGRRAR